MQKCHLSLVTCHLSFDWVDVLLISLVRRWILRHQVLR